MIASLEKIRPMVGFLTQLSIHVFFVRSIFGERLYLAFTSEASTEWFVYILFLIFKSMACLLCSLLSDPGYS